MLTRVQQVLKEEGGGGLRQREKLILMQVPQSLSYPVGSCGMRGHLPENLRCAQMARPRHSDVGHPRKDRTSGEGQGCAAEGDPEGSDL